MPRSAHDVADVQARNKNKKPSCSFLFILLTQNSALLDVITQHARSCLCTSGRNSYAHVMYSNCDKKNIIAQLDGKTRNLICKIRIGGMYLRDAIISYLAGCQFNLPQMPRRVVVSIYISRRAFDIVVELSA